MSLVVLVSVIVNFKYIIHTALVFFCFFSDFKYVKYVNTE